MTLEQALQLEGAWVSCEYESCGEQIVWVTVGPEYGTHVEYEFTDGVLSDEEHYDVGDFE